ncbi:putative RNA-binding protein [Trypanosoma rangeli]|uniref:Putative RNA-binding protein n=1 Tax=Trypanosoma rangeli TaxID=5698 RepID=A0A3R7NF39_TRYRA|nr:putative RNA-binding protein [Trypanosoma rangeli]RNF01757.1 putative RNA-binding protein [Trypanosoma rangeli]|eukprot:RNF01757.1 putative RNA-binding protein [Trypanosoma rangeli]
MLFSNMDAGSEKNGIIADANAEPTSGKNTDRVEEVLYHEELDNDPDGEFFSGGGGLYMESDMKFVIDLGNDDDDVPIASFTAQSEFDSLPGHRCVPDEMTPRQQADNANNESVTSQHQQQLPRNGYPASTGNGSTHSDVFLISYSSWTNHVANDSAAGEMSPGVSSLDPAAAAGGGGMMSPQQPPQQPPQQLDEPFGGNSFEKDAAGSKSRQHPQDEIRSNLFVSGLHFSVTDKELYNHFRPYGEIESAKVMLDIHTGKSRGIAFVKFKEVADAAKAADDKNNSIFHGETIAVRVAKPHAAYRPGAPTNKTFVRNIPLSVKKADLIQHFGRYGDVMDVSIHNDTAQRSSNKRRNVAFITYTTMEAAANAAKETHTSTPFLDCEGVPLLAKVAEDSAHRTERLARRGVGRHGNLKNSINSAGNSVTSYIQGPPPPHTPGAGSQKALEQTFSASAPVYPFMPPLGGAPVLADPYSGSAAAPTFYAAPFISVPPGHTGAPPVFLVGPESRPAVFAPPLSYSVIGNSMPTMAPMSPLTDTIPAAAPAPQMMMYPPGTSPVMAPQSTFFCYLPNGQMTLAATQPQ